ncbi:hypothetical protein [Streptomyces capitiformicae]|uniref:hypothetical protein n=1 Tax=Streptomyces capitiformicae TaxID=2014920 RepID=UPI001674C62F|nr:hypothetical protein [Streptomyces capitiformicae]
MRFISGNGHGHDPVVGPAGDGTLQLGMTDAAGACSQDNKRTMTVQVSVTRQG